MKAKRLLVRWRSCRVDGCRCWRPHVQAGVQHTQRPCPGVPHGKPPLAPEKWTKVHARVVADDALFDKYYRRYTVDSVNEFGESAPPELKTKILCNMRCGSDNDAY